MQKASRGEQRPLAGRKPGEMTHFRKRGCDLESEEQWEGTALLSSTGESPRGSGSTAALPKWHRRSDRALALLLKVKYMTRLLQERLAGLGCAGQTPVPAA